MANYMKDLVLENVPIIFKNFAGKEGRFNAKGNRTFSVVIEDPDLAEKLASDGWNVKENIPKNSDYDPINYIKVSVTYGNRPPKVVLISGGKQTLLDEDNIETLDYAEIIRNNDNRQIADVVLHPYIWEVNGKTGVKAYLKSMYVTIEDDPLARKYDSPLLDDEDVPF